MIGISKKTFIYRLFVSTVYMHSKYKVCYCVRYHVHNIQSWHNKHNYWFNIYGQRIFLIKYKVPIINFRGHFVSSKCITITVQMKYQVVMMTKVTLNKNIEVKKNSYSTLRYIWWLWLLYNVKTNHNSLQICITHHRDYKRQLSS